MSPSFERDPHDPVDLGATGVRVQPLGVGAWAWGDRWLWGYGVQYDKGDLRGALQASLNAGVTLVDTAEIYGFGRSERLVGDLLGSANGRAVVATKFLPFPWRLRRADLLRALRASLRRLGLDRVDLYQIHYPLPLTVLDRWSEALADAVAAGLVGAVGVSNYSALQTRRAHEVLAKRGVPLATNQIEYNLMQRAAETNGVFEACRELGVTIIAYSPLKMGMLTGKYDAWHRPSGWHRRGFEAAYFTRWNNLMDTVRDIGARVGKSPAQVALNWCIAKGTVPIPGAKNERQAVDNAGALGWRLAPDHIAILDEANTAPPASSRATISSEGRLDENRTTA